MNIHSYYILFIFNVISLFSITVNGNDVINHSKDKIVPVVYMAINYRLKSSLINAFKLSCFHNSDVKLLTNVKQDHLLRVAQTTCLEIIDISQIYEKIKKEVILPPNTWPSKHVQRYFFERWFVLRDWLKEHYEKNKYNHVFTMDSDVLLLQNVTEIGKLLNEKYDKYVYLNYMPPRTSMGPGIFFTYDQLADITSFWSTLFNHSNNFWTTASMKPAYRNNQPNDMTAMGHYLNYAYTFINNLPTNQHECWGVIAPEECHDHGYSGSEVFKRLRAKNITVKYLGAPLNPRPGGESELGVVIDHNLRHDPLNMFEMKDGRKQIRYIQGHGQLKFKTKKWINSLTIIMEDSLETCVNNHLKLIFNERSCICPHVCCSTCKDIIGEVNDNYDGSILTIDVNSNTSITTNRGHIRSHVPGHHLPGHNLRHSHTKAGGDSKNVSGSVA